MPLTAPPSARSRGEPRDLVLARQKRLKLLAQIVAGCLVGACVAALVTLLG